MTAKITGAHLVAVLFSLTSPLVVALVGCSSTNASPEPNRIPIGFIGDDDSSATTAQLIAALRNINEAGGVEFENGRHELKLEFENHGNSVDGAVLAMERLKDKGVAAVLDPAWSSLVLGTQSDFSDGAAAAAKDLDMVIVSGGATSPLLTNLADDNRVFRTVASDAIQGELSASRLIGLGVMTASIIYRDDAWGRGLSDIFQATFEAQGGTVVASVSYPEDASIDFDFASRLEKVFEAKPGAVLVASFDEVLAIASQIDTGEYLAEYEPNEPMLIGTDGFFDPEQLVVNLPASFLDRLSGTVPRSNPESADYREASAIAGTDANESTLDGSRFDAINLIALAIQAAGENDASKIKSVLRDISRKDDGDLEIHVGEWKKAREALLDGKGIDYEGASGGIEFDENGDRTVGWIGIWKVVKDGDTYGVDDNEIVPYGN